MEHGSFEKRICFLTPVVTTFWTLGFAEAKAAKSGFPREHILTVFVLTNFIGDENAHDNFVAEFARDAND